MQIFTLPVDPVLGPTVRMIAEGQKRGHIVIGNEPDIATLTTVATIGTAHHHGSLAPKRDTPRATIPAAHVKLAFIDEL
jgi:hypothetical protein